ncbi:SAM-dependent methyltransferase [Candidatus Fermentibacteria bacterium]|nr:MAG: SAM-dependent methyltransferase [Candidatus Fermentibacteria bacterium]
MVSLGGNSGRRMSMMKNSDVCPVELHGILDNRLRKLIHNPKKILAPFIRPGDRAIDIGSGPGFFTIPMAELAGTEGTVIAADLQQGMLDIIQKKIENTPRKKVIRLHRTEKNSLNLSVKADFILLFYVVHEIENRTEFFRQIGGILKETGKALLIEHRIHVTKKDFEKTKQAAQKAGLKVTRGPKLFFDRTSVITG